MNYFEFYELPICFNPDQNLVKQQFYALSKQYHPDFYINQSQEKQAEALELSTLNNKAFQVLKDAQKRLYYVLTLKGELVEGENYSLPQDFLMEMMEINEALMELQFEPDTNKLAAIKSEIETIAAHLNSQMEQLTTAFDATQDASLLKDIKGIYYRNKYLARIKESIKGIG